MPWKECHVMDERVRFVARLLEGEKMAPLCAEFGISRKTGYKIFDRYKDCGLTAFNDRSRRPYRQANRLPAPLEAMIVRLKREYPGWGAPKIREKLRQQTSGPHVPAISTVHAVLDRHGLLQQQARFDTFVARYNGDRPHQALAMKVPAEVYTRSPRPYRGLSDLTYPFHDATFTVTHCGRICFHGRKINLSHAFAGQNVGVTQVGDRIWLVTFMDYDLGYFDDEVGRLAPIENPFGSKLLPMCPE